ncbi:MAG: choice-of-anchor L domain-containing protein, partial [Dinghuibacter sp.]|nr:choice-of-anchor L domain-containing protein [Dinghuibacter sp.]
MKYKLIILFLFCALLTTGVNNRVQAQININPVQSGQELVDFLLGRGIVAFNIQYNGSDFMSGIFRNRANALALDSGIVLTSGLAQNIRTDRGINSPPSVLASNDRGGRGDSDIDQILQALGAPPLIRSRDACILEFDFIPTGDTVSFRYTFGSEEYPDYNCSSFNDMFLFFISGPGITGRKNMAIVPGTANIPVAINSINNGVVNPRSNIVNCEALGAGSPFTQFYVDNTGGSDIVYNGLTVTLRAFQAVLPCRMYHMKLVIADLGDGQFDSGVFLEAGSFQSEYATLAYNGPRNIYGEPTLTEGCDSATITINYSRPLPGNRDLLLETGGTAENSLDLSPFVLPSITLPAGQTSVSFPLSAVQDGISDDNEYLTIYVSPKSCGTPILTDSLRIRISDYKRAEVQPPRIGLCPGNGGAQLNVITPGLTNYLWTPAAGLNNTTIPNPFALPDTTTLYTVTATITSTCKAKGESLVEIKDSTSIVWYQRDISCVGNDGSITVIPGYSWVNPEFSLNGGPFTTNNIFSGLVPGWYVVTVRDATGCSLRKTFHLIALEALSATIVLTAANCFGRNGKIVVTPRGGVSPYQYSLDGLNYQTDNNITLDAGPRTLYVKDFAGCMFTLPFTLGSDAPIQFSTQITPDSCRGLADGSITITATGGSGTYKYSTNGTTFQPGNFFRLVAGTYTVTVEDDKGCFATRSQTVPLNNTVTLEAGADSTICEGKTINIRATGNALRYLWTPATGLNYDTLLQPLATPSVTTLYKITATSGLCVRTDSLTIVVNRAPVANAGPDTAICYGDNAQLQGSGSLQYVWFPAQYISNRNIANPVVYPRRTGPYWLHVISDKGCRSLLPDSVQITVVPPVRPFAGNDTIVSINQPVQLQATGGTRFIWQPATGLNNAQIANPVATLQNHQTYTITAYTPEGCSGSTTLNIKVYRGPEIYVAGAFTPNADGQNDILFAVPAGIKQFRYFRVFNRWGKEVFATNNYRNGWNGTWKSV